MSLTTKRPSLGYKQEISMKGISFSISEDKHHALKQMALDKRTTIKLLLAQAVDEFLAKSDSLKNNSL